MYKKSVPLQFHRINCTGSSLTVCVKDGKGQRLMDHNCERYSLMVKKTSGQI